MTDRRLIEVAFPLKQASLDSVHEKNVRHGHISTLHIWPARRPLAACRAALIATLLPDPGTPEMRRELCDYSRASGVSIAMPPAGAAPAPPAPASDTRASAEVALKANQLQDFVDVLPDILKATAGLEMSFRMTVEVKGKERPSDKAVVSINKLLEGVDQNLRVQ